MMKRKNKMKIKKEKVVYKKIKKILLLFLFFSSTYLTYFILNTITSLSSNEVFLRDLISESNHFNDKNYDSRKIVTSLVQFFSNVNIKEPSSIFSQSSTFFEEGHDSDESLDIDEVSNLSTYVKDPFPERESSEPIVYLYNTHQLEQYSTTNVEPYNITPNVMMTSYILREKLGDVGIPVLVEENNVTELLKANNWNYASSYKITKMLMEDALVKNPSLSYFVDIHRDSVNKKISTTSIDHKNYAKVLFIVGLENPNYELNLALTTRINNLLNEKYPSLSRGIYKKEGKGVNGVYNQDFNKNTILIEMGGYENTIDEVLNSTEAIASVLKIIIEEDRL